VELILIAFLTVYLGDQMLARTPKHFAQYTEMLILDDKTKEKYRRQNQKFQFLVLSIRINDERNCILQCAFSIIKEGIIGRPSQLLLHSFS